MTNFLPDISPFSIKATLLLVMGLHAVAFAQTVKLQATQLTEKIYLVKGKGGNIAVLTGPDGVLMVDSQFDELSDQIMKVIDSIGSADIKFLINTHIHYDHTGGNENFKRFGASIIAHENVGIRMKKEQVISAMDVKIPPLSKSFWPAITFHDKLTLHFNDEDIDLYHFSSAHTDGDVLVHFRKANVFHMGDMIVRFGYPFIDLSGGGSFGGFLTFFKRSLEIMDDNSRIIIGHGDIATKKDAQAFYDNILTIQKDVAKSLANIKRDTSIATNISRKYDPKLDKGFVKGKDFVLMIAADSRK